MKKRRTAVLAAAVLAGLLLLLSACGCWDGGEADLVFVNDTDIPIGSVGVRSASAAEVGQYADNSLICRGGSIGFGDVEYPVTVTVYADLEGRMPLASRTIEKAPAGDRWYVTARNSPGGLVLEPGGEWPLDGRKPR